MRKSEKEEVKEVNGVKGVKDDTFRMLKSRCQTIVLNSPANKVSETPALPPEHQLERKNSLNSFNSQLKTLNPPKTK